MISKIKWVTRGAEIFLLIHRGFPLRGSEVHRLLVEVSAGSNGHLSGTDDVLTSIL